MTDRPETDDDDEVPRLPEVTVPPWLRTGPTPEQPIPGVPAGDRSPRPAGVADATRAGSPGQDPSGTGSPPTRITLGAADRSAPDRSAPDDSTPGGPHPHPPVPTRPGGTRRDADELSTLSLATPAASPNRPPDEPPPAPAVLDRRPVRIALLVAAGVAVLGGSAVLGYVVTRGAVSPAAEQDVGCVEVSEPGRVVGSGPGSLSTPAGAVLAFDHAYYVERSAEKAFAAVAPSSRMTEEQLRADGVEQVADGTAHCVEVRELSPTLLEVDLTEYPPEADPVLIRQRVRVAENPDGTWGIVSITPAG